jgi:hypothetical protein
MHEIAVVQTMEIARDPWSAAMRQGSGDGWSWRALAPLIIGNGAWQ